MHIMPDIRFLEGCMLAYLASLQKGLLPTEREPAGYEQGSFLPFRGRSSGASTQVSKLEMRVCPGGKESQHS